jgi:hypothetical protein
MGADDGSKPARKSTSRRFDAAEYGRSKGMLPAPRLASNLNCLNRQSEMLHEASREASWNF